MNPSIKIDVTEYHLRLGRGMHTGESPQLRGFFGRAFADEVLLHHQFDGSLLYKYPRVQFKILEKTALLLGIAEGSELLSRLWLEVDHTTIGNENLPVIESKIIKRIETLSETIEPVQYCFLTPWMALNQKNYELFVSGNTESKDKLLKSILIGNILSLSKSLAYKIENRIHTKLKLTKSKANFKNNPMITFYGNFFVNFHIPDYLGIGKSVSRGFGAVISA